MLQRSCSAVALVLLLGGVVMPLGALLRGQTAQPDNSAGRVFKTSARIVVIDVVVTGKNHRPLTGLHQQDFQVAEDGHPQTVHYFEEHSGAQPVQVSVPDLPPNVFTNIPRVKPGDSVTVLVLDSLNTPLDDERRVHAQVLKYLKKPQPGRRIAIFTLGTQLRLIQSFTDDPALLAAALNQGKKGAQVSPLLQSTAETASTQETVAALMDYAPEAAAAVQQFAAEQVSIRTDLRIRLTTSTNPATDGKYRKIQVALDRSGYQLDYRRGYYADDGKSTQAPAAKPGPGDDLLSPFLRPGRPNSTQIPLTLRVTPSSASPGAGQGGDNPNLKGALTRYSVDLMIPARSLQFDLGPDGHHHVRIEAGLMVYNRVGNPLNWILRPVNLNLDDSRYAIVQANGVNLYLQIDGPEGGVSLRGGVYDLNTNLTGTLAIPLSAITTTGTASAVPKMP